MITLRPLIFDTGKFLCDLRKEIEFMEKHNPNDEIEIVMGSLVRKELECLIEHYEIKGEVLQSTDKDTMYGIPVVTDNTLPPYKADVRLKHTRNDFITNRFMRIE